MPAFPVQVVQVLRGAAVITLSDDQLDKMRAARRHAFAEELAVRARQRHPDKCDDLPDKDLIAAMDAEIAAARKFGLKTRRELKRFSDLAMIFGLGFSTEAPWAAKVFANDDLTPGERLTEVEETGVFVLMKGA